MAIAVEHTLIGKDAVGRDKIIDFGGVDRAAGLRDYRGTFVLHVRFGLTLRERGSKIPNSSAVAKSVL
jgi:hypothetical protein